jgi:hypothetical protein
MNRDGAMICFTAGLVIVLGGVGGVESSVDTAELLSSTAIAVVGLLVMACGALAIRVLEDQ